MPRDSKSMRTRLKSHASGPMITPLGEPSGVESVGVEENGVAAADIRARDLGTGARRPSGPHGVPGGSRAAATTSNSIREIMAGLRECCYFRSMRL